MPRAELRWSHHKTGRRGATGIRDPTMGHGMPWATGGPTSDHMDCVCCWLFCALQFAIQIANWRCYGLWSSVGTESPTKKPGIPLNFGKDIFAQRRATSKGGVDSTWFDTIRCSHTTILDIIWLWHISVPPCLCLGVHSQFFCWLFLLSLQCVF